VSACQQVARLLEKTYTDSRDWNLYTMQLNPSQTQCIAFLNAHAVTYVYDNPKFFESLKGADYVLRDGIGVRIALKFFGYQDTENLNGTDLIPKIIEKWKDKRIAIYGASDQALVACKTKLEKNGVHAVVSMAHGFHEPEIYIDMIKNEKPDLVILCMGMPKQEFLALEIRKENLCPIVVCGGGWADFYSETKQRAPEWVRKLSLEWLHRLTKEPKRLGKRYTLGILYFFYIIIKSRISIK